MAKTTTIESLESRIDKMASWAAQVEQGMKMVKDLKAQISDAGISQELAGMWKQYLSPVHEIHEHQRELIALGVELDTINDEINRLESQAMLDVNLEINGDNKPKYTNDLTRKAAVTVTLAANEEYKELVERARLVKANMDNLKADVVYGEGLVKEFCTRNHALVSRLNFDTAVINNLKEGK